MELLDRYLLAVKPGLPRAQRDDILAELSENLRAQMDERASELGRPLTETEQEEILQSFGQPLVVAGRYQPGAGSFTFGRELIGPELFPFYLKTLQVGIGIAYLIILSVQIPLTISESKGWGEFLSSLVIPGVVQVILVTAVWVGIQAYCTQHPLQWNVKSLPKGPPTRRVSRVDSVFQIVVGAVSLCWVQAALGVSGASLGPCRLTPVWHEVYVPALATVIAGLLQSVATLFNPEWVGLRSGVRLANGLVTAAVAAYLLVEGRWVVISGSIPLTADQRRSGETVVHYTFLTILVSVLVISLVQSVLEVRALRRSKDGSRGEVLGLPGLS